MIKYIVLLCSVLVNFTNIQAQQLNFRRIPSSFEKLATGYWASINSKTMLYDPKNRAFLEQSIPTGQWSEIDHLSFPYQLAGIIHTKNDGSFVYTTYSSAGVPHDSIVQHKPDGSKQTLRKLEMPVWGSSVQYEYTQGGLYACGFNGNPTGSNTAKMYILIAKHQNGAWTWNALDSIPTYHPEGFRLFRDPLESSLYLTVTDYEGGAKKKTTYRSTNSSGWTKLDSAISYVEDGVQLGNSYFVAYESKLCRTDANYSFFTPVDSIPAANVCRVNDSTAYSWYKTYDKQGARIYYTTNGGKTFRRHPASQKTLPISTLTTLVGSEDGTVYVTSESETSNVRTHYSIRDTTITRIASPNVETTRDHPGIVVVHQAPGLFFALPPENQIPEAAYDSCLYDLTSGKWMSLSNAEGKPLFIKQAFSGSSHAIVNTDSGLYVLNGPDLRVIRVDKGVIGRVTTVTGCNFVGNVSALVLAKTTVYENANKWYSIDLATGAAKMITSDWLDGMEKCRLTAQASSIVDSASNAIVAGISGYWTTTGDSSVQLCNRYGVLISTDEGATWRNYNEGFGSPNYCWDVQVHNGTLYALMSYSGYGGFQARELLYRREPGDVWKAAGVLPIELRRPMKMSVQPSGNVYFCNYPIFRSTDKGETLELLSTNFPEGTKFTDVAEVGNQIVTSNGRYVWVTDNPLAVVNESITPTQPLVRWDGSNFIVRDANESIASVTPSYAWDIRGNRIPLKEVSVGIYKPLYDLSKGLYMLQIGERYYRGLVY